MYFANRFFLSIENVINAIHWQCHLIFLKRCVFLTWKFSACFRNRCNNSTTVLNYELAHLPEQDMTWPINWDFSQPCHVFGYMKTCLHFVQAIKLFFLTYLQSFCFPVCWWASSWFLLFCHVHFCLRYNKHISSKGMLLRNTQLPKYCNCFRLLFVTADVQK